jgi:Ca-activated chloride channel family protein
MRVHTFAVLAALGAACAVGGAMLVPTPSARGQTPVDPGVSPAPQAPKVEPHFVDGKVLLLDGRLGHASVARTTAGATAETFVLATVTGTEAPAGAPRAAPPVHLAIVVDRSGSMAGAKMASAIAAATGAVERMRDGDRVTLVSFDTTARVLVPPTALDAQTRPSIQASIRGMRVGGDTCISCALTTATATLDASPGVRDEVKRILLISDGEATTGVRDVSGLRALAARARDDGFAVSTIGLDLAFDEKVMAAIAEETNGRHFFVPDATALPRVFEEELGALQTAVATEAELTIEPAPGVVVDEVLDRSFRRDGGRVRVPLGAFDARQEKTVLVRVHVPADGDGVESVARLGLAYRDVERRGDGRCEGALSLEVRSDGGAQRELDPFVLTRVERSRTARTLTDANDLFSKGRADEARAALAKRKSELATAVKPTIAAATALPAPARGATRAVDEDFLQQQVAIEHASTGFAPPPFASTTPMVAGAGRPAEAAPASAPAAKSAVKENQAAAVDLRR